MPSKTLNALSGDLDDILARTRPLWEEIRGKKLFITGGTGFFGSWLLESFAWINDRIGLDAQILVLTRDPAAFARKAPHLAERKDISFQIGDVRDFAFPKGTFSHVIHAATEASAKLNDENPALMLETIIAGTKRVLEFAAQCGATKFLLTSSGAIYGTQPPEITHLSEEYSGAPDVSTSNSAYAEGKRVSELLCAIYGTRTGIEMKIARCFAFVGPFLPLDAHFAIGNFIRDAMAGGSIRINGDGTPYRSYLYAADLTIWLWTILFGGAANRPYNVGSDHALSIAETARAVAVCAENKPTGSIAQKPVSGRQASRYVPNVDRAKQELGLQEWTSLEEGIRRTIRWHSRENLK